VLRGVRACAYPFQPSPFFRAHVELAGLECESVSPHHADIHRAHPRVVIVAAFQIRVCHGFGGGLLLVRVGVRVGVAASLRLRGIFLGARFLILLLGAFQPRHALPAGHEVLEVIASAHVFSLEDIRLPDVEVVRCRRGVRARIGAPGFHLAGARNCYLFEVGPPAGEEAFVPPSESFGAGQVQDDGAHLVRLDVAQLGQQPGGILDGVGGMYHRDVN
jgi:hypothetical protein